MNAVVPRPAISADEVAALTGLKFPKWQIFVAAFASGMGVLAASIQAGYKSPDQPRKLLKKPEIAAALRAVRAEMAKRAEYGMDALIVELDAAADFAIETENATALVRARELKAKALGLLVDRMDLRVQQIPFRIVINGIDDTLAVANG
jgi:uncharacterized MAPEG superfamily protein